MKIKTLLSLIVTLLFLSYFTSCDSSSYEAEEIEVYEDSVKTTANSEIKQEIELPKADIIEETTSIPKTNPVKYTVQIGAFGKESNALDYLAKAKNMLPYEFVCIEIGGLYKVRTGEFDNLAEALDMLNKISSAGFYDSFVTGFGK